MSGLEGCAAFAQKAEGAAADFFFVQLSDTTGDSKDRRTRMPPTR